MGEVTIKEILCVYAFYPNGGAAQLEGATQFQALTKRLSNITPWLQDLCFDRAKGGGTDILSPGFSELYACRSEDFKRRFPEAAGINALAAAGPCIKLPGGHEARSSASYYWSIAGELDQIEIQIPIPEDAAGQAVTVLSAIVGALTQWRQCLFVTSLPSALKRRGRAMPGFHTSGAGIWIGSNLTTLDLPAAFAVATVLNGTLILP